MASNRETKPAEIPGNPVLMKQVAEEMDRLYHSLVKDEKEDVSVISETDFVSGFLPYFAGELNIPDNKAFISTWIGIAGNPNKEVAVVDNKNQELFRVPALLNTKPIEPRSDGRVLDVMDEYITRGSQFSALADQYLNKESINITTPISEKLIENKKDEERWNEIFKRYGKKLPQSIKDNKEIILEEDDDMLDYE